MEHRRRPLSKENTLESKHNTARFSSFSLPNLWVNDVLLEYGSTLLENVPQGLAFGSMFSVTYIDS